MNSENQPSTSKKAKHKKTKNTSNVNYPVTFDEFVRFVNVEDYVLKEMQLAGEEKFKTNYAVRHKYYPEVYDKFYSSEATREKMLRRGLSLKPVPLFVKKKLLQFPEATDKPTTHHVSDKKKQINADVATVFHKEGKTNTDQSSNIDHITLLNKSAKDSDPKVTTSKHVSKTTKHSKPDSQKITEFFSPARPSAEATSTNHQVNMHICKVKGKPSAPNCKTKEAPHPTNQNNAKIAEGLFKTIFTAQKESLANAVKANENKINSNNVINLKGRAKIVSPISSCEIPKLDSTLRTDVEIPKETVKKKEDTNKISSTPRSPLPKKVKVGVLQAPMATTNEGKQSSGEQCEKKKSSNWLKLSRNSKLYQSKVGLTHTEVREWLEKGEAALAKEKMREPRKVPVEYFLENYTGFDRISAIKKHPDAVKKYVKYLLNVEILKKKHEPKTAPEIVRDITQSKLIDIFLGMSFEDYKNLINAERICSQKVAKGGSINVLATDLRDQYNAFIKRQKPWPEGLTVSLENLAHLLRSKGIKAPLELRYVPPRIVSFPEILKYTNLWEFAKQLSEPNASFNETIDQCRNIYTKCRKQGCWIDELKLNTIEEAETEETACIPLTPPKRRRSTRHSTSASRKKVTAEDKTGKSQCKINEQGADVVNEAMGRDKPIAEDTSTIPTKLSSAQLHGTIKETNGQASEQEPEIDPSNRCVESLLKEYFSECQMTNINTLTKESASSLNTVYLISILDDKMAEADGEKLSNGKEDSAACTPPSVPFTPKHHVKNGPSQSALNKTLSNNSEKHVTPCISPRILSAKSTDSQNDPHKLGKKNFSTNRSSKTAPLPDNQQRNSFHENSDRLMAVLSPLQKNNNLDLARPLQRDQQAKAQPAELTPSPNLFSQSGEVASKSAENPAQPCDVENSESCCIRCVVDTNGSTLISSAIVPNFNSQESALTLVFDPKDHHIKSLSSLQVKKELLSPRRDEDNDLESDSGDVQILETTPTQPIVIDDDEEAAPDLLDTLLMRPNNNLRQSPVRNFEKDPLTTQDTSPMLDSMQTMETSINLEETTTRKDVTVASSESKKNSHRMNDVEYILEILKSINDETVTGSLKKGSSQEESINTSQKLVQKVNVISGAQNTPNISNSSSSNQKCPMKPKSNNGDKNKNNVCSTFAARIQDIQDQSTTQADQRKGEDRSKLLTQRSQAIKELENSMRVNDNCRIKSISETMGKTSTPTRDILKENFQLGLNSVLSKRGSTIDSAHLRNSFGLHCDIQLDSEENSGLPHLRSSRPRKSIESNTQIYDEKFSCNRRFTIDVDNSKRFTENNYLSSREVLGKRKSTCLQKLIDANDNAGVNNSSGSGSSGKHTNLNRERITRRSKLRRTSAHTTDSSASNNSIRVHALRSKSSIDKRRHTVDAETFSMNSIFRKSESSNKRKNLNTQQLQKDFKLESGVVAGRRRYTICSDNSKKSKIGGIPENSEHVLKNQNSIQIGNKRKYSLRSDGLKDNGRFNQDSKNTLENPNTSESSIKGRSNQCKSSSPRRRNNIGVELTVEKFGELPRQSLKRKCKPSTKNDKTQFSGDSEAIRRRNEVEQNTEEKFGKSVNLSNGDNRKEQSASSKSNLTLSIGARLSSSSTPNSGIRETVARPNTSKDLKCTKNRQIGSEKNVPEVGMSECFRGSTNILWNNLMQKASENPTAGALIRQTRSKDQMVEGSANSDMSENTKSTITTLKKKKAKIKLKALSNSFLNSTNLRNTQTINPSESKLNTIETHLEKSTNMVADPNSGDKYNQQTPSSGALKIGTGNDSCLPILNTPAQGSSNNSLLAEDHCVTFMPPPVLHNVQTECTRINNDLISGDRERVSILKDSSNERTHPEVKQSVCLGNEKDLTISPTSQNIVIGDKFSIEIEEKDETFNKNTQDTLALHKHPFKTTAFDSQNRRLQCLQKSEHVLEVNNDSSQSQKVGEPIRNSNATSPSTEIVNNTTPGVSSNALNKDSCANIAKAKSENLASIENSESRNVRKRPLDLPRTLTVTKRKLKKTIQSTRTSEDTTYTIPAIIPFAQPLTNSDTENVSNALQSSSHDSDLVPLNLLVHREFRDCYLQRAQQYARGQKLTGIEAKVELNFGKSHIYSQTSTITRAEQMTTVVDDVRLNENTTNSDTACPQTVQLRTADHILGAIENNRVGTIQPFAIQKANKSAELGQTASSNRKRQQRLKYKNAKRIKKMGFQQRCPDYVPQKVHAFRSLAVAPTRPPVYNKNSTSTDPTQVQTQQVNISKKGTSTVNLPSTASQILATDCTYFENSELLRNINEICCTQQRPSNAQQVNIIHSVILSEGLMARKVWKMNLQWKSINNIYIEVCFTDGKHWLQACDDSAKALFNFSQTTWSNVFKILKEIRYFEYTRQPTQNRRPLSPLHKALWFLIDSALPTVNVRLISEDTSPYVTCERMKYIRRKPPHSLDCVISPQILAQMKKIKENLQLNLE